MARPTSRRDGHSFPTGTVTFLFSDIEGSTRLVAALGPSYGPLLERHQALLRTAFDSNGGVEIATEGDSFFVVFGSAASAVTAAAAAQRALAAEPWPAQVGAVRVRIGLHTGEGRLGGDNYVGLDLHRAARIAAAAHGGQVLMSDATRALVAPYLPGDVALRDLGVHRLKDLDRPERLVQLVMDGLPEEFPPPRTLAPPTNLPVQMTTFVGRDREIGEVVDLVGRSRLVTLVGPGGTGKTRLGLQVAERLRDEFPDGSAFVDLSPIGDPDLVAAAIGHALGVREETGRPILESVEAHLRDRRVLLVIDNFEQVLGGAPLVSRLLRAAPGLNVLVTSREVLHVQGEQEYVVPSLGVPDLRRLPPLEALAQYDAVVLFAQRARAVRPGFEIDAGNAAAVAEICARLDGLPLAIELAAARVKLLAPSAILARLEKRLTLLTSAASDLPPRQRTLRGAIEWSHDLLDPAERRLFRRLAVFVGGCTIDDAQAVCDPRGELGVDMLDALTSLVDKSLLRHVPGAGGEPRFAMLETIREYAGERLADSEDRDPGRRRYEAHFASLARQAQPELLGPRQKEWLDRLEGERDNLRAAVQTAAEDGRSEAALEIAASLWRYWQQRGHLAEGRQVLDRLLGPGGDARTVACARALAGLGGVAYWQGDFAAAGKAYARALEIARTLDDRSGLASALYDEGFVAAVTGDHATARADYEESLGIYAALGDQPGVVRVREALVFLMFLQGEFVAAKALQEENLRTFRDAGEPFRLANGLNLLSAAQLKSGDVRAARASQAEALGVFRAAGDMQGVVRVLVLAAAVAVAAGDLTLAARLSGAVDTLREPLGDVATPVQILGLEDPAKASRVGLGEAAFEEAYQAGRTASLEEIIAGSTG